MTVSGLTGISSRCCLQMPVHRPGVLGGQVSSSVGFKPKGIPSLKRQRYNTHQTQLIRCAMGASYGNTGNDPNGNIHLLTYWIGCRQRYNTHQTQLIRCAMGASYGNTGNDPNASSDIFPRINVSDPYKRLGVNREASEYEIQSARNFLIHKYAGHKPSLDAIESAHDKIIMQKFYDRKNPRIDIDRKIREVSQSKIVKAVVNYFRTPRPEFMIKTSIAFLVLGVLTVLFPTDDGPTFQVGLSFFTTMYFINEQQKDKFRVCFHGVASFVVSWLLATSVMVVAAPRLPMFRGALRGFETISALITYVFLWGFSTYLKK